MYMYLYVYVHRFSTAYPELKQHVVYRYTRAKLRPIQQVDGETLDKLQAQPWIRPRAYRALGFRG